MSAFTEFTEMIVSLMAGGGGGDVAVCVKESLPEPVVRIKGNELELSALEFLPNHGKPFLLFAGTGLLLRELMKPLLIS